MSFLDNFDKSRLEGHAISLNVLIDSAKENLASLEAELVDTLARIKNFATDTVEETVETVKEEVKKAAPKKKAAKKEEPAEEKETPAEDTPEADKAEEDK